MTIFERTLSDGRTLTVSVKGAWITAAAGQDKDTVCCLDTLGRPIVKSGVTYTHRIGRFPVSAQEAEAIEAVWAPKEVREEIARKEAAWAERRRWEDESQRIARDGLREAY